LASSRDKRILTKMRKYFIYIIPWFRVLLPLFLTYLGIRKTWREINKIESYYGIIKLIILWVIIGVTSLYIFPSGSDFQIQVIRKFAIESLREISQRQRKFYRQNKQYATTFKQLGCNEITLQKCIKGPHSFYYMNDDCLSFADKNSCFSTINNAKYLFPSYPKNESMVIYAVFELKKDSYDILSIDYQGNLKVIKSLRWWLPDHYGNGGYF